MQEDMAAYVVGLIRQGFMAGVSPRWTVSFEFDHYAPEGERQVETNADIVEKGICSGPGWKLTLTEAGKNRAAFTSPDPASPASVLVREEVLPKPDGNPTGAPVFTMDDFILVAAAGKLLAAGMRKDQAMRIVRTHADEVLRAVAKRHPTFMVVAAEVPIADRDPSITFPHDDESLQTLAAERSIFISLTSIRVMADMLASSRMT